MAKEPKDLRRLPTDWADFAVRLNTVLLDVLSSDLAHVERIEIQAKQIRIDEAHVALRKGRSLGRFRETDPLTRELKNYLAAVDAHLRCLRPKPEYRRSDLHFEDIRICLLDRWSQLKDKMDVARK